MSPLLQNGLFFWSVTVMKIQVFTMQKVLKKTPRLFEFYIVNVKSTGRFGQIFEAFLENL